jgi:Tol biopolymer transport system component
MKFLHSTTAFLFGCWVPSGVVPAQSTERVSLTSSGTQANGPSWNPSISANARSVAFGSDATNLVPGDTNGYADIFVRDRQTGQTIRVSVASNGAQVLGYSGDAAISADGRFVAFTSDATTLVAGDTNMKRDVFVHEIATGQTTRVSVDSSGVQGNGNSSYIAPPSISGDGRYVAFGSDATNLVPGDSNGDKDVFVHDLLTGQTTRVSLGIGGVQANGGSSLPTLSTDGRYVVYSSCATNLVASDTNAFCDAFVRDLWTGATTLVSVDTAGVQANQHTYPFFSISSDGRYVAFSTEATNLVPGDTNALADVFVHDLQTGQTTRVSVDPTGAQGNGNAGNYAMSADGRSVVFQSIATNLVPGDMNSRIDVFVRDLTTGQTTLVDLDLIGGQSEGDTVFYGLAPSISADGRYVAFGSNATNLVAGDTNASYDIFVRDRGANPPVAFCFGDGTQATACPCANNGAVWHGCQNSAGTGGAVLTNIGVTSPDTLVLVSMAELPSALSIFLQGNVDLNPGVLFGDGVRCVGGSLKRLYAKNAVGGVVSAPGIGDPSISARSAMLGDPLAPGSSRSYQVYYRDPNIAFCPPPMGDAWNVSTAHRIVW